MRHFSYNRTESGGLAGAVTGVAWALMGLGLVVRTEARAGAGSGGGAWGWLAVAAGLALMLMAAGRLEGQAGAGPAAGGVAKSGQGNAGQANSGQANSGQVERVGPRFVVVLDAAHGGDDGGGQVGGTVTEKTVTLELSVRLRSLLTARGISVVTTREGNANLSADQRAQVANHAGGAVGAAACLSLHATETGSGVHIFVSSLAPAGPTRFMAWKTAQAAYVTRSLKLASALNSGFEHGGDSGSVPANLARTSLPGVDSMACPAVALEVAPLRGEDRKIVSDVTDAQYLGQVAEAVAAAMLEWRSEVEAEGRGPEGRGRGERQP